MAGTNTNPVREDQDKIKIRRSNGRVQYVSHDELDRLNDARKHRDQMRHSRKTNPNRWFALLIGAVIMLCAAFMGMTLAR